MIRATFRLGVCRRHSERKDERKRGFKGSRYTRGTILRRDTVTERGRFEAITFSAVFLVFRTGFGAGKIRICCRFPTCCCGVSVRAGFRAAKSGSAGLDPNRGLTRLPETCRWRDGRADVIGCQVDRVTRVDTFSFAVLDFQGRSLHSRK